MTYADASFLAALFARDDHGQKALAWWRRNNAILTASRLVLFEAENCIRTLPLAGKCTRTESLWALDQMKRARLEGLIEVRELPNKRLFPAAQRLSLHHSDTRTFGAMDIIHVATALELSARTFLSFDGRQRELAETEGLETAP